jgi:hypothetical protein
MLTVEAGDVDEIAVRIAELWERYNTERRSALTLNEEARRFIYATDIDSTSAADLPHKNRTHQPKLTQIADTLKSQYYEASLSMPEFFRFPAPRKVSDAVARAMEKWIRVKLEARKFRETTGRQLINDYVDYGNCFVSLEYTVERDNQGRVIYTGPVWNRVSPMDIAFNPRTSFKKSPKMERLQVHVADIKDWPDTFPNSGFKKGIIAKAIATRHPDGIDDWIEVVKNRGINMDGYGGFDQYFKQDLAEIIIYRGDMFDPNTSKTSRNRVIYIMDKVHVIRNEPSKAPSGFDGIHHAGWRLRPDNSWSQGPLDNLIGMQYRIDHLENLKADIFDVIAQPVIFVKGDDVQEPSDGYRPGAVYYGGVDSDVKMLVPDATALNADNQIANYHRMMEDWAGVPPESRGIRTPGEKTAFEVSKLDQNATMGFVDKARVFERMMETMLKETFELMLINFDIEDYKDIFGEDEEGEALEVLASMDTIARGEFVAMGARHWTRRNRETLEMNTFMSGPMQDPKIRAHVSGIKMAEFWERKLNIEDEGIIEENAGVKEDVRIQAIAQEEAQALQQESGSDPIGVGDQSGTGTQTFTEGEGPQNSPSPSGQQPGASKVPQ